MVADESSDPGNPSERFCIIGSFIHRSICALNPRTHRCADLAGMANVCGSRPIWPSRLRRARLFPRRWPGNPFGQGEVFMIFVLTKILSGKQFLRADFLRAISRACSALARVASRFAAGLTEAAAWIRLMVVGIRCSPFTGLAPVKYSHREHRACRQCFRNRDRCGTRDSPVLRPWPPCLPKPKLQRRADRSP